jgi:hypothetical protein
VIMHSQPFCRGRPAIEGLDKHAWVCYIYIILPVVEKE